MSEQEHSGLTLEGLAEKLEALEHQNTSLQQTNTSLQQTVSTLRGTRTSILRSLLRGVTPRDIREARGFWYFDKLCCNGVSATAACAPPPGDPVNPVIEAVSRLDLGVGVRGEGGLPKGIGVVGQGHKDTGVLGHSDSGLGVHGASGSTTGVFGSTAGGWGVHGLSRRPGGDFTGIGVFGEGAVGVQGRGGQLAGLFEGDVEVTGDVRLTGGDCAEEFDVVETEIVEPGTVMVLGEESELRPSYKAYDKRVAGVISGAGDYKPGLVLDKRPSERKRQPIALLGKAYCKVDAEYAPIEIGDLLTTSPTQGHAMKATDPLKAFGTVIGKALRPAMEAQNLIPILITLQ